jgi:hypothetical protein
LRERLLSRLVIDPSGCLLWTGATSYGYGRIYVNGRLLPVHRVMWEMFESPIPDGYQLDHVKANGCTNHNCASIAHLEPVTPRENVLRGDTIAATSASVTHCPKKHEYTPGNTFRGVKGERRCRECHLERCRLAYQARKAAAACLG